MNGDPAGVAAEVRRLLGLALGRPLAPGEAPARETHGEWSSLKHVELVFMLEDHFGLALGEADVLAIDDLAAAIRVVEGHLAARDHA